MASDKQVTVKFTGDETGLKKSLDAVNKGLSDAEKQAQLAEAGLQKIGLAAGAIGAATGAFFVKAAGAAAEYDRTIFGIEKRLEATGGTAGVSIGEIQRFADQLGDATLTSEEATLRASRALLSFQSIQGDTFFRALTVSQDLAETLGGDLEANVIQVAKALEDPVKGLGALSRSGTQFTQQQQDLIKSLVETGQAAKAQEVILAELEKQYGGTGVAAAQGLVGAQDTLGENINDVVRIFGDELTPVFQTVTNAAANLLNAFIEAPPVIQKLVVASTAFVGALSAATAVVIAYNAAKTTQTALELKAAAAMVTSKIATLGVAGATKAATVATFGYLKAIAPLLLKLGLLIAAFEAIRTNLNILGDGGAETQNRIREYQRSLEELGVSAENAAERIEAIKPKKAGFFDFLGRGGEKLADDQRVAIGKLGDAVNAATREIDNLGNSTEDTAKKQAIFKETQALVQAELEALDEETLGTEAYEDLKMQLEVTGRSLEAYGRANELIPKAAGEATDATEDQTAAIEKENEAISEQIAELEKLREVEKRETDERREDEAVALARQREDAKAARQEQNQDRLAQRQKDFDDQREADQTAFNLEQEKLKDDREAQRLQAKRDEEDYDRQEAERFEMEMAALQESFTENEAAEKSRLEEQIQQKQKDFESSQQKQAEQFADGQRQKEQAFNQEIEAQKDAAATARRDAEKALADEISARLDAQSQGFSEAGRQLSEAGKLAAVESEKERQKLIDEFEDRRRQEAEVAALDLAGKVFSPEELIAQAKEVANIRAIKSEKDAKALQDALALIEAEQRAQQAEADKLAQLELQESLQEQQAVFEAEIEARKQAFAESQESAAKAFQESQEAEKDRREQERQGIITAAEEARQLAREQFEASLEEKQKERELALIELRRLREDVTRKEAEDFQAFLDSRQKAFDADAEARAKAFQAEQNGIQESFENSERNLQRAFEDEQRKKERAFNAEERAKDEALAQRIAALNRQIAANAQRAEAAAAAAAPTEVEGLFKGGPVTKGRTYLVGERNPEPLVFDSGKVAMVGTRGPELIRPMASGYVYPNMAALNNAGILGELQGLRGDIGRSPRAIGAANYTIVGAQDPVKTTIKLQQERIRQQSRLSRL